MDAGRLVELASIVAAQGPALVHHCRRLSPQGVTRYWIASRCRQDRWLRMLKVADAGRSESGVVLEEIITGEMLTRTWAAVTFAHDRYHQVEEIGPITRSVLVGHVEVRHRALRLLVRWPEPEGTEAVRLNRLRRQTERWTDLLLGYLLGLDDVAEFAFDPQRARDFAEDLSYRNQWQTCGQAWTLVQGSLRETFGRDPDRATPNADLNTAIATGVMACFPAELCEPSSMFGSLWLLRMAHLAEDTQHLIAEALNPKLD